MDRTLEDIDKDIADVNAKLKPLQKKLDKGKKLSASETRAKALYDKNLEALNAEKENFGKPATTTTPAKPVVNKPVTSSSTPSSTSTEKKLEASEKKAQEAADEMNSEELQSKKKEDAASAAETAKDRASQVDANVEENIPTWFWREAQEMAPTDKAKRGFIITNHILNRLGTATGNIGAIVQNAGGSGGASLKEHGGSLIDQYRQGKIEQAIANRKKKQDNLLQQQIDALIAIGASENEARAIQNKLRNSAHWNKYNRLSNEQQVYIQGLLYNDTQGKISDAVLGNFIDQLMEGKDVSLEQATVNVLTAAGIDNVDNIKSGATGIKDKVFEWLNWNKPGM